MGVDRHGQLQSGMKSPVKEVPREEGAGNPHRGKDSNPCSLSTCRQSLPRCVMSLKVHIAPGTERTVPTSMLPFVLLQPLKFPFLLGVTACF